MQLHLNTYGTYLHVKDQLFEVKVPAGNGQTEKHQVAAHKVKSIWLAKGIALSTDAVHLAMKHNIDIVFLENDGKPVGRVWHTKLGSTTLIRKRQLELSLGSQALGYVQKWLNGKLQNQVDFILSLRKNRMKHAPFLLEKSERISVLQNRLANITAGHLDEVADVIRGWEGTAGRLYFETLSHVLPQQYKFQGRSSRPAADPFNACLNYAYGVLYSKVEKALILAGIDPFIGFLHRDGYNYKSMVYDFIEPFRYFADKPVFQLFSAKKIRQDHVDQLRNGVKLNKTGKVLLITAFNKHLEEDKIRYKGRNQTRANVIQFEAHQFANGLIQQAP